MNSDQIKYMVNRFLAWRLPEKFNPDGGISFKPLLYGQTKLEPVGTNLLDATQAEEMIRYLVDGLPAAPAVPKEPEGTPQECMAEISDEGGSLHECCKQKGHKGDHVCGKMWAGSCCHYKWRNDKFPAESC